MENLDQNQINNASFGSGRSSGDRGAGKFSGSGSVGTLPPCKDCFGHGRNPSSNPNCQLGCRGLENNVAVTPGIKAVHYNGCSKEGGCHGIDDHLQGTGDKSERSRSLGTTKEKSKQKLKNALVAVTIVGCVLAVIVLMAKNQCRKLSSVGVNQGGKADDANGVETV